MWVCLNKIAGFYKAAVINHNAIKNIVLRHDMKMASIT